MFPLKLMCSNVFRAGLSRLTPSGLFKPQGGEQAVRAQPQGSILFEGERSFHSKTVTPTYSVSNVAGDCSKGSLPALGSLSSASLLNGFMPGGVLNWIPVRTNIRNHFPRPKENKRIKVHGWKTRMSTPGGRRVIMRRILKGRHILSHDIVNFVK